MLPKEMIYEIYNFLGNTDKRRLRQTSTKYDIKFRENDILQELIEDGYDIPEKYYCNYIWVIILNGRLDLVKKTNIKMIINVCSIAAVCGQLEILKYTHESGCLWNTHTCRFAAGGHLECLKYAHEHGCPWDEDTCRAAAQGHLECLIYARENECPWDEQTCRAAAQGHLECLKYAYENECPWSPWTLDACRWAARGHPTCLAYLNSW